MTRCLLALGSNLGDRQAILGQACAEVKKLPGCQLLARSCWHGTVPIGGAAGQDDFLNGALLLDTTLPAEVLTAKLQQIETRLGRQRVVRWDARPIDIDVLLYGTEVIDTERLIVPHPRMTFRNFVLEPAVEIAGEMLHPTSGWTLGRLLAHLQTSPRFVVVAAPDKTLAEGLVSQLAQAGRCSVLSQADKNSLLASVSLLDEGVQFPASQSGLLPLLMGVSPEELAIFFTKQMAGTPLPRPALIIALDSVGEELASVATEWFCPSGLGPVARITTADQATVLQEAEAALRCIWPDLPALLNHDGA